MKSSFIKQIGPLVVLMTVSQTEAVRTHTDEQIEQKIDSWSSSVQQALSQTESQAMEGSEIQSFIQNQVKSFVQEGAETHSHHKSHKKHHKHHNRDHSDIQTEEHNVRKFTPPAAKSLVNTKASNQDQLAHVIL